MNEDKEIASDDVSEKQFDIRLKPGETNIHPRIKKTVIRGQSDGWKYFSLAGELGFDIALPMALGLIVGTKLDARWGTSPKIAIGLFVFGLALSCASLIRIVKDVSRKG